jgi:hypothetical protein
VEKRKTKAELLAQARADSARLRALAEKAQAELDKKKQT